MNELLTAFISGQAIVFPVKNLDKFMKQSLKLDELKEYDLQYEGDEVMVKRRMKL